MQIEKERHKDIDIKIFWYKVDQKYSLVQCRGKDIFFNNFVRKIFVERNIYWYN